MLHNYQPTDIETDRSWRSISMSLHIDAELNYLLEKKCFDKGSTKKAMILKIIEDALKTNSESESK